jgi:cytochrome c-type biogenesis protein
MQYIISLLEGIISFISPCLLPMLPIYVTYFAAGNERSNGKTSLKNAVGFVLGFTIVFVALGLLFGTLGSFLQRYSAVVNIVLGAVVVLFGLGFMGIIKPMFGMRGVKSADTGNLSFFKAMMFGMIFSVSWTPCVGAFLGSALALASVSGSALQGTLMLLCFSAGLGIPFILSAILIDKLKSAFNFIKRNYRVINFICGLLLVIIGILMMTGLLGEFLNLFSR